MIRSRPLIWSHSYSCLSCLHVLLQHTQHTHTLSTSNPRLLGSIEYFKATMPAQAYRIVLPFAEDPGHECHWNAALCGAALLQVTLGRWLLAWLALRVTGGCARVGKRSTGLLLCPICFSSQLDNLLLVVMQSAHLTIHRKTFQQSIEGLMTLRHEQTSSQPVIAKALQQLKVPHHSLHSSQCPCLCM